MNQHDAQRLGIVGLETINQELHGRIFLKNALLSAIAIRSSETDTLTMLDSEKPVISKMMF